MSHRKRQAEVALALSMVALSIACLPSTPATPPLAQLASPYWRHLDGKVFRSTGRPGHSTYYFREGRCRVLVQACMGGFSYDADYSFQHRRLEVSAPNQWVKRFVLLAQGGRCIFKSGEQILERRADLEGDLQWKTFGRSW